MIHIIVTQLFLSLHLSENYLNLNIFSYNNLIILCFLLLSSALLYMVCFNVLFECYTPAHRGGFGMQCYIYSRLFYAMLYDLTFKSLNLKLMSLDFDTKFIRNTNAKRLLRFNIV